MNLVLIGTDHRLQHALVRDEERRAWAPRKGGLRYRKLLTYCIEKFDAKAILEETHPSQEKAAPTIASLVAKERAIVWETLGLGEIRLTDALIDPPLDEAFRLQVSPEPLAGVYNLELHKIREAYMYMTILDSARKHDSVIAIVGYVHLGVLAQMFEANLVPVKALLFTYPLIVDESRS